MGCPGNGECIKQSECCDCFNDCNLNLDLLVDPNLKK